MKRSRSMLILLGLVSLSTSLGLILFMSNRSLGLSTLNHKATHIWLHAFGIHAKQLQSQVSDQVYETCVFGDSITSPLRDTLGSDVTNFAVGGLSTSTLLVQLNRLKDADKRCNRAIVAIGTNDACFGISDVDFMENLRRIIAVLKGMGANQIKLIPAFYSTYEASQKPDMAGTLGRIDEINALMAQVAEQEQVRYVSTGLEPLYSKNELRADLTSDGVHLNSKGQAIYRQFLTKVLNEDAP